MIQGLFDYFLISFAALFVIINPVTTAFIFNSLLPYASKAEKSNVAFKASLIAFIILILFSIIGTYIFSLFGVTMAAFKIAGGLILFGISMKMLKNNSGEHDENHHTSSERDFEDIAIIPLAIPFISGPGSIATVMLLSTQSTSFFHLLVVILTILIVVSLCYLAMKHSDFLVEKTGNTAKRIINKVFGLILAVISVQFILNGIASFLPEIAHLF
ncbi:MAG: MarC family protein [Candidatus Woesearchaeota archaeon]